MHVEKDIAKLGSTERRKIAIDRIAWREVANQALDINKKHVLQTFEKSTPTICG